MEKTKHQYPTEVYEEAIEIKDKVLNLLVNDIKNVPCGDAVKLAEMILGYSNPTVRLVTNLSSFPTHLGRWEFAICSTRSIMEALVNPTSQVRRDDFFKLDIRRNRVLEDGMVTVHDHRTYQISGKSDNEILATLEKLEGAINHENQ